MINSYSDGKEEEDNDDDYDEYSHENSNKRPTDSAGELQSAVTNS